MQWASSAPSPQTTQLQPREARRLTEAVGQLPPVHPPRRLPTSARSPATPSPGTKPFTSLCSHSGCAQPSPHVEFRRRDVINYSMLARKMVPGAAPRVSSPLILCVLAVITPPDYTQVHLQRWGFWVKDMGLFKPVGRYSLLSLLPERY